jgi:hypothetical protein
VGSNPVHGEVFLIQYYVIKVVILCDKSCQWLTTGRWFSLGAPVSSTHNIQRHDITEISLKVALITINLNQHFFESIDQRIPIKNMWRKTRDSMTIQHILYKFDWGAQVVLSSKQFVTTMYIYRSIIIPRLQWHWRHIHGENPVSPFLYYFFLFARFQLWSGALSIKSGSTFAYGSF